MGIRVLGRSPRESPILLLGAEIDMVPRLREGNMVGELDVGAPLLGVWPVIVGAHYTAALWPKERDEDRCPQQEPGWMTEAYCQVVKRYSTAYDPTLTALGHIYRHCPPPSPAQLRQVARVARQYDVVLELNINQLQHDKWLLEDWALRVLAETRMPIYIGTNKASAFPFCVANI